jgi:hypothetical protein
MFEPHITSKRGQELAPSTYGPSNNQDEEQKVSQLLMTNQGVIANLVVNES